VGLAVAHLAEHCRTRESLGLRFRILSNGELQVEKDLKLRIVAIGADVAEEHHATGLTNFFEVSETPVQIARETVGIEECETLHFPGADPLQALSDCWAAPIIALIAVVFQYQVRLGRIPLACDQPGKDVVLHFERVSLLRLQRRGHAQHSRDENIVVH
jgi:hypothetical protein